MVGTATSTSITTASVVTGLMVGAGSTSRVLLTGAALPLLASMVIGWGASVGSTRTIWLTGIGVTLASTMI